MNLRIKHCDHVKNDCKPNSVLVRPELYLKLQSHPLGPTVTMLML